MTNRCSNRCTFCVREGKDSYEGYSLWLKGGEPAAQTVIDEIGDPKRYGEIVFCGFGEPTYRLADILEICAYVHERGGKTRLNTNGHGSIINGRDIVPDLKGNLDGVNISLNAPDGKQYRELCRPQTEDAYEALLAFARSCAEHGVNAWFSVVDCIGAENVQKCREIADMVGLPLRVREMIE